MPTANTSTMSSTEIPSSEISTLSSRTPSTTRSRRSSKSQEDVAATRHLRLMINSIAENSELTPQQRKERIANFEKLLQEAEKKLHFSGGGGEEEALLLHVRTNAANNKLNAAGVDAKKEKNKSSFLRRFRRKNKKQNIDNHHGDASSVANTGPDSSALETVVEERRDDHEQQQDQNVTVHKKQHDVREGPSQPPQQPTDIYLPFQTTQESNNHYKQQDDDELTRTSSIIDVRLANSEDYVASICSIRSLGTFEKDFINNIIAEQQGAEEISVSTFEQDAGLVRNANVNHGLPLEIGVKQQHPQERDGQEIDDLTVEPILSETTFERDARKAAIQNDAEDGPPMQVEFSSDNAVMMQDDDVDDDDLSETTFEQDQRRAAAAATTRTRVNDLMSPLSESSVLSVSTFEKDAAARNALAIKIGRIPSTTSKNLEMDRATSEGTFEKDQRVRQAMSERSRRSRVSVSSAPGRVVVARMPSTSAPIYIHPTESETVYERDANCRNKENDPHTSQQQLVSYRSRSHHDDGKSQFEKDVSRNMTSQQLKLVVLSPNPPPLPRINDLVVELSPRAIEKQEKQLAKKKDGNGGSAGSVMARFLCHCGLGERNMKLSLETN